MDRTPEEGLVDLSLISGEVETFAATARHDESSPIVWTSNAAGEITCSLGGADACGSATHLPRKEIMGELHQVFGDDVSNDVTAIELKGTLENSYVEFERKKSRGK